MELPGVQFIADVILVMGKLTMDNSEENQIDVVLKGFQDMYDKMQLPKHREATEAFFRATAEELNATYKDINAAGETKVNQQN